MKKVLALVIAMIMMVTFIACEGSSTKKTNDEITIGVILKTLSSEYWGYVAAGVKAAEKDFGVKVNLQGPASETSYDEQNNMIETTLSTNDLDALVVAPLQPESIAFVLGNTQIPILFVDTDAEFSNKTAYIGTGNYEAAYLGGEYAAKQKGKGAIAVVIAGVQGNTNSYEREKGYIDALEAKGVKVASVQYAEATTDKATNIMENMLTSLKNNVDIVCCVNDDMAAGAANACKQAGVEGVTIVGFDGIQTGVKNVMNGVVSASVAQSPYNMGYQAVENAVKAVKGEEVEKVIKTGVSIITSENAKDYLAELKSVLK
ncbi:sugar ABC transporter substrate-binding protein [Anaerosacchariphilus polymeriproducens]|uniref:Sugar ABC transporter substrate-binding protein n=1 Tax=Anaerosacchariphilus polymeriproducens TaxID=1812858 RepID=A0A371AXA9_9FIRM|nr:sugar ABC transporter substrate-binding protein [Anaerosacchariphilus polymeriproducens]RDU24213.1 sugar ABC transporter substrate-binding protein [Anaerosacchariphilus polymeriproducens]